MSRLLKGCQALARSVRLWAQRSNWPVPTALRNVLRKFLIGAIGQSAYAPDDWSHPLIAGARNDSVAQRRGTDSATLSAPTSLTSGSKRVFTSPPLRCVVATHSLSVGGLDRVAAFLARGLPFHGIETTLAHTPTTDAHHNILDDVLRLDGVPIVNLCQGEARKWLKTTCIDVISAHGTPDWFVADAGEAGIPVIETLHGAHSFFEQETWPRERLRSKQISGFVAVSELVRRQYLRANPDYPPERIVTIPNAVDDQHISVRDRTKARAWLGLTNEFLFVSLARYHMQKNTFGLVKAFSDMALAHPDVHLLVAGNVDDVNYLEQVRRLREQSPCASRIHLRGNAPDASAVLAAADAFVLDSFFEGWSLASMEALFVGLPVIMSEVGGAHEQVGQDGSRGFVVGNPLGDPETMDWRSMSRARFRPQVNHKALVEALSAVVADRDRWRKVRGELRAESMNRFSADVCLQRHAEVLTRAAAGEPLLSSGNDIA